MAVLLATFSVVMFYSESILVLYQASLHNNDENRTFFFVLLSIFVASQVLTNTASALLISIRMDFSGKPSGRLLCAVLHLGQQGVIWRLGKLVMFYDQKDWLEIVLLRMIIVSVQTLPYLAIQSYLLLTSSVEMAMAIISLLVSLMSASIGLTSFTIRNHVHAASWESSTSQSVHSRKHCGYVLLLIGTALGLASRICSIILMSVEKLYWIAIPLGTHMFLFLLVSVLYKIRKHEILSWKDVLKRIVFSYLNIFDLADEHFSNIQCKYVSYYTIILVENIVMTAVWLMNSSVDYTIKLVMIVSILTGFICALILKFTAGGLLFRRLPSANTHDKTPDVKSDKYVDNVTIQQQQLCITTDTNHRKACHNIDSGSQTPRSKHSELFDMSVTDSAHTSNITNKPLVNRPLQRLQCKQKCNSYGDNVFSPKSKHKIINVASFFDGSVNVCKTKVNNKTSFKGKNRPVVRCYVIPHENESKHSSTNLEVHSSNSRNTNTLALSNITSSQVSNEILTQDYQLSRSKRFKFQQYPKAVLLMIKKHKSKIQKKKSKVKLFSPPSDSFSSCDRALEYRRPSSGEQTINCYETEVEEFNWDEDFTSYSSSTIGYGHANRTCSITDSFMTDISSTSISTWPLSNYKYFNPTVLPKQHPNSAESIKHWLNDVHRHSQEIVDGRKDITKGQEGITKRHQDTRGHQDITEGQMHQNKETQIQTHSNENSNVKSSNVFERFNLNSTTDDGCYNSDEDSCSTISVLCQPHIIDTKTKRVTSSDEQLHIIPSQESLNSIGLDGNETLRRHSENRTFPSDIVKNKIYQQTQQASHSEQLSIQTEPFCVQLDNMESLV